MGCDIHFFVERKSTDKCPGPSSKQKRRDEVIQAVLENEEIEPRWISADKWEVDSDGYWSVPYNQKFYRGRDYTLFSILADVRNWDIEPICQPRGIPEDAGESYLYQTNMMQGDAHSHSYFTLAELQKVDWGKYTDLESPAFLLTLERMAQLDNDPENVRCCFFFDN